MKRLDALADWLDERMGSRAWAQAWLDAPLPAGSPWGRALGVAVVTCLAVLAVTGVVLMTAYAPSPQTAWASVHYVQFVEPLGWVVRGLHFWAAQTLFILAALHILHGALTASYRSPREICWWLTLAIFGLAIGEGITGGLLPWDQRGWWARQVEGNIVGLAPAIGGWLAQVVSGGAELGALGLTRAHAVHVVVLPLVFGFVLWARHRLAVRAGTLEARSGADVTLRSVALERATVVALFVVVALFALAVLAHGAALEAPADPLSDYPARPEWFLLTLFQLRKLFHGPLEFWGTTLVPGLAAGYFAVLPWIDRPPRSRASALMPALAIFVAAAALAFVGYRHDAVDPSFQKARAKWDHRAAVAQQVAMNGVPPAGALAMVRHDPELRGQDVFERHCAGCHVLDGLGDPKKATATKLDGWGTVGWIEAMAHEPDAPQFFGRGPYKSEMPSIDTRPKEMPPTEAWKPMIKSAGDRHAIALFLASLGREPGEPTPPEETSAELARGEKIVSDRCTECHLYKGEGDDDVSGLAPELAAYGSIAWTRAQVANPATPQTYREKALNAQLKKHMPRFDKDLSAEDIDLVARWTRTHARASSP